MRSFIHIYWPGLVILVFALITGSGIYQDYGMSIDEHFQLEIGEKTYAYIIGDYTDYANYVERDHGSGFEVPLYYLQRIFNITKYRDIYLMRHLVSYIFFVLCMFSSYWVALKVFKNRWLASLALIALIFHPRLFAHSFFNTKDVPAAGTYLLAIAATVWAWDKKKLLPFIVLGLICGYSASIRLMNIIILAPVGMLFLYSIIDGIKSKRALPALYRGIAVLISFCLSLYICWPTLWEHPILSLFESFKSLSAFRWDNYLLFEGYVMHSLNLPWNYIPTWFFITIPEIWLLAGIIGITLLIARFIDDPGSFFSDTYKRYILFFFTCFALPLTTILILDPVVYDGWRHMYFIYPPFVFLAIYGLKELLQHKQLRVLIWALCIVQVAFIANFMVSNHPFQQVYFNHFVSHKKDSLMKRYELDYWGVSSKHALDWILQNSNAPTTIKINHDGWEWFIGYTISMLPDDNKERFVVEDDINKMDYYIQFFRTNPYNFPFDRFPDAKIVHEEYVLNSPIYRIIKVH